MKRKTTKKQTYNREDQHGQKLVLEEVNKTEKSLVRQRGRKGGWEGGGDIKVKYKKVIISDPTDNKMITRTYYE